MRATDKYPEVEELKKMQQRTKTELGKLRRIQDRIILKYATSGMRNHESCISAVLRDFISQA